MSEAKVVLVTIDSKEKAEALADSAVGERLAACVNLVPGITSIYSWKGEICKDSEWLMIFKTSLANLEALKDYVLKHHPYDTPEFIVLPIESGSEDYLRWLMDSIRKD